MIKNEDIALRSRVRLARNLKGLPFPHMMDEKQMKTLIADVNAAINGNGDFLLLEMDKLPAREKRLLIERHLISPELAKAGRGAALINKEETLSIMIGEEDHLRIQSMQDGLNLQDADTLCSAVDRLLERKLAYAFDKELGYLTACPTNLGSGMRASVMMHLPALSMMGGAEPLLSMIGKLGYAVRGYYGEGSKAPGHIYQISNQMTLGILEEDILSNLSGTVLRILEREAGVREPFYEQNKLELEDRLYRSLGLLGYARKLTVTEAMEAVCDIKLACGLGLMPEFTQGFLNKLLVDIQPGALEQRAGEEMNAAQQEMARAQYIREQLKTINNEVNKDERI
ncbi:protein arginine kinase [Eubacteriales bacterium OttesenSCG-928-K08]|nr:protein arginine kinase [Eubacteriales bacterium OttesenSCG-928-K08]